MQVGVQLPPDTVPTIPVFTNARAGNMVLFGLPPGVLLHAPPPRQKASSPANSADACSAAAALAASRHRLLRFARRALFDGDLGEESNSCRNPASCSSSSLMSSSQMSDQRGPRARGRPANLSPN